MAAREGRFEAEGWRVRKDGTRFWAHVIIDAVRAEDGSLLGYAKITRDITSKREQEKALFESEQRFRMLVQGVKDAAIYMLDTEGRVTNWNAGAEAIKGYTAAEIVGQHFSRFYTGEDRANGEPKRALETALREGKYEREAWRVRKDGSLFWAHVLLDPIFNEAGEHVGFAKITRDATERKKAQEELEETRAELAQSQKLQALGELAGGVAHDFNNVMTVILGAADFLRRRPNLPADKRQQYVEAIYESGVRATRLTDQLLAFGRRRPVRNEVVDVNASIDALSEMLSRTLGSRIETKLELANDAGRVKVDPAQLEMAILNAVVNARDAMPGGGTLTISTCTERSGDSDCVRIDVHDTGLGMPERVMERAFDPFFTTKAVGEGTGLGLSQIHGFAAQSGGRAELDSAEGMGTTVTIILPQTTSELTHSQDDPIPAEMADGVRVLLVEDNPQVRTFAEDLLKDLRCEVVSAESGDEALAQLERHEVDVVLSDIVMPGMSGIDLCRRLKELRPDLPVILATGYSEQAAQAHQAVPIVLKPYSGQDIATAIAAAVAASRNQVEKRAG
jgi:PAS domain S-box-containing protein